MNGNTYDPTNDAVSVEVVNTIAEHLNIPPTELPQLGTIIDPDALDALCSPEQAVRQSDTDVFVQFEYAEENITISSNGRIWINEGCQEDS